jgi:hypothetical protein
MHSRALYQIHDRLISTDTSRVAGAGFILHVIAKRIRCLRMWIGSQCRIHDRASILLGRSLVDMYLLHDRHTCQADGGREIPTPRCATRILPMPACIDDHTSDVDVLARMGSPLLTPFVVLRHRGLNVKHVRQIDDTRAQTKKKVGHDERRTSMDDSHAAMRKARGIMCVRQ